LKEGFGLVAIDAPGTEVADDLVDGDLNAACIFDGWERDRFDGGGAVTG
jgi:hypothetical protein